MSELLNGNQQWVDSGGDPILNGKIFIGLQGADPVLSPKDIFSDRDLTVALTNPQLIDSFGFSANKIYLSGTYSLRVEDANAALVIQELDNGEAVSATITTLTNVLGTNTLTANASPTITALNDKQQFVFGVVGINTAAVTLNIDGLGAKSIQRNLDQDVVAGQFEAGQIVLVVYNASDDTFEWTNHNNKVVYLTKGADVASLATTLIWDSLSNILDITGTTTITSFGTAKVIGSHRILHFDDILTLTNGANLVIPGGTRTTAAGDTCEVVADTLTIHRVVWYQSKDGKALIETPATDITDNAVDQATLKDTNADTSTTSGTFVNFTTAAGLFGFYTNTRITGAANCVMQMAVLNPSASYVSHHSMHTTVAGSTTAGSRQHYIQASPPYDMGDGVVHSFLFAIIDNASGLIESASLAPDPPWANNGPTIIKPDRIDKITGKKYRKMVNIHSDLKKFMDDDFLQESEVEITTAFKNSDMGLIPHPFQGNDLTGKTVVIIDPMSKEVERFEAMKNAGGSPPEILHGNYLVIGNEELNRGRPNGVMSISVKMKNSV